MSQNSERLSWTFEEVDAKLKDIMVNICHNMDDAAKRYGMEGNYVAGANIAGFEKVVDAMTAQGIVFNIKKFKISHVLDIKIIDSYNNIVKTDASVWVR